MKYTFQISTAQYEYIQGEIDGTADEAVDAYKTLLNAYKSGIGLQNREWCKVMDSYVSTGKLEGGAEVWERMNDYQRSVIQELKRCFARNNK